MYQRSKVKKKKKEKTIEELEGIMDEENHHEDSDDNDIAKTAQFFNSTVDGSLETKGIILLENEVDFPGITVHAKKLVMDIASTPGIDYLELYINSNGGDVMQFMSLHDSILMAQKFYKTRVATIVNGTAASAAALVLQAGNPRLATRNSWIMIHEISFGFEGKFTTAQEEFSSVKRLQYAAFKVWADKMGITVKELCNLIAAKDVYFSAAEAKKKGLIDMVI
jgi:ATP-dependent Clp endopeptidase proteolytic subunit ClpP